MKLVDRASAWAAVTVSQHAPRFLNVPLSRVAFIRSFPGTDSVDLFPIWELDGRPFNKLGADNVTEKDRTRDGVYCLE